MQAFQLFSKIKGTFSKSKNDINDDLLLKDNDIDYIDNNEKNNLKDIIHPKTIQLSEEEELAITKIESKCYDLNNIIDDLENNMRDLDKLTKENELYLTKTFDDIIFSVKMQKKQSIQIFNDTISYKQDKIIQQINDLTLYQTQITKFKEKTVKIKNEGIMNEDQIHDFIINRAATLINIHEEGSVHTKSLINPYIDITLNTKHVHTLLDKFGDIDQCQLPLSPNIIITNITCDSIQVNINEKIENNPNNQYKKKRRACSEEYKIEMLQLTTSITTPSNTKNDIAYCWEQVAIVISLEVDIKHLKQDTEYMIRCCCKNKYGFGPSCKPKKFKTLINDDNNHNNNKKKQDENKSDDSNKYQYIYLAPTQKYQDKLLEIINENGMNETTKFFKKWKGFHITIGPKLSFDIKDEDNKSIYAGDIICELSKLGLKNFCGKTPETWQISNNWKISKWKIGDKKYIVVTFNDNDRLLNVSATYLKARGWKNVKQNKWNITLGLDNDLNTLQINQMVNILISKYESIEWKWFSIIQNKKGDIQWEDTCYSVYKL